MKEWIIFISGVIITSNGIKNEEIAIMFAFKFVGSGSEWKKLFSKLFMI